MKSLQWVLLRLWVTRQEEMYLKVQGEAYIVHNVTMQMGGENHSLNRNPELHAQSELQ